jgi:dienelactone hydrolase
MKRLIIIVVICFFPLSLLADSHAEYQRQGLTAPQKTLPVFYQELKAKLTFSLSWSQADKTGESVQAWRVRARAKAQTLILPYQDNTDFDPYILDEQDRGSYTAKKVVFNISQESRILGLMLVPKSKGPHPAVLMLHDHGARFDIGKEKMIRTWGDRDKELSSAQWSEKHFSGKFPGDELAKRGFVVLSIDALGWGDRSVIGYSGDSQQALASNFFNLGVSFAGLIAAEDKRSLEFLSQQSFVDNKRVGVLGFSMGAFRAWQLSAVSDDVAATVAINWMATVKDLMVPENNQTKGSSAFTMLHPYLLQYFDYPDVASLSAPKPFLLFAGEQDKLFPVDSVKVASHKMSKVWQAHNALERYEFKLWAGGHSFNSDQQAYAIEWLESVLVH